MGFSFPLMGFVFEVNDTNWPVMQRAWRARSIHGHSRQQENPATAEIRGVGTFARRRVGTLGGKIGVETDLGDYLDVARAGHVHYRNGNSRIFDIEVYVRNGEVVAWLGHGQFTHGRPPAHMARFAAAVRIVGAKAEGSAVKRHGKRHTGGGGIRRHRPAPASPRRCMDGSCRRHRRQNEIVALTPPQTSWCLPSPMYPSWRSVCEGVQV